MIGDFGNLPQIPEEIWIYPSNSTLPGRNSIPKSRHTLPCVRIIPELLQLPQIPKEIWIYPDLSLQSPRSCRGSLTSRREFFVSAEAPDAEMQQEGEQDEHEHGHGRQDGQDGAGGEFQGNLSCN